MRKGLLPVALGLSLTAGVAAADVLVVPEGEPTPPLVLPAKGASMAQVQSRYGEPRVKRPTVGGNSAEQPPITRWDYDSFVVIFERDKVIDGVIPGAPPPIVNRSGLEQARLPPTESAPAFAPQPEAPAGEAQDTVIVPAESPAPFDGPSSVEAPPAAESPAEKLEPEARESAVPR